MKRKSIKQRVFATFLAASMVFTMTPMTSFAEEMGTDTVSEETQVQTSDSEAIEALQSRIGALPTVDEFIALADGTTVEDSTLNQAQLDVYNEAQAIAEEMDKLTDEEQGQLDTGKLEALFEYFNSMTEETASNVISPSSSIQTITSGGTYTVKGGTYSNQIQIKTTSAVTLNIEGNITASDSKVFISAQSVSSNLTINGNGYAINQTGDGNVINSSISSTIVTLNNCVFKSTYATVVNKGTIYVQSGSYSRTGSSGQVFSNAGGTLYIQGGTITNVSGENDAVAAGNVYMTGGTVSAPNGGGIRLSQDGTKAEITGGTISGSKYGVYLKSGNPTCKIGNVTFSGNTNDVYLASGHTFTLSTDYAGANNIKVGVADTVGDSVKRQITTTGTDKSMLAKVSSVNSSYSVNYDTSGKYLYLWKHSHSWNYSASGNTVTAKCNTSSCGYSSGLTLTLTAPDMDYTGSAYDKAEIENKITSVTGATASTKYVGRGETNYTESTTAPTDAGTYTAKVTIGGATATVDFTINKAEVTKPSADETKFTYNGSSQTYNIAASDKYTVTGNTRTDAGTQTVTVALKNNYKWSDGSTDDLTFTFTIAKADLTLSLALKNWIYGRTPSAPELGNYKGDGTISYFYKKQGEADTEYKSITEADFNTIVVGKYTLKASVSEGTNYNAATAECDFAVTKQPITVSVSMDGWTYGEEAKTPSVTVKAEDSDITSSYEKSQITYTYYTDSECKNEVVPKNAGTYYVKAGVEATDNYSDGSAVAEFIIAKKAVTATVTADNKTYDGTTNATVSAVVADSDLVSGDKITIKGITGTFEDQNAGTDKKVTVDSSNAEYAGTGVDNYDITIGTEAKASIDKLTAEFKWSNTDLTYTGSEQSVTAEVSNAVSGDKFTLTYEGNKQTAVGSYTATVTALGNDNYALPTDNTKAQTAWKISYLAKGTAEVSGTKGDNDWYITKVTITPESGYEISTNGTDWKAFLEYDAQGSQTATYYLKETATGFISDEKTAEFKIDTELPTGEIKIKDNGFTEFLNTITFNHFFKKTVDVKITGADTTSGIAKIEYQKVAKGASFDKDGTWTEGKSFSMTANDKSAIYARITDKAGHSAIINSDGIVVYTDATATAEETFTKTSTADVTTGITVNGNTIASVKNGSDIVAESAYEIKEDKLVLKASYLQTLSAGKYTLTVSYNPYEEAYTADSKGDAPDTSVITLTVVKAEGSITKISDISKVYDGNAVTAPTFTTTNDRGTDDANVTIEYKKQGADDSTYTSEAPKDYGKYVVRITVKSDDDYETVVTTKEFSIHKKEMKVSADGYTGTYDGQAYGITVSVTDPADSEASNVKVVYGTKNADGKITYSENPVTYKDAGEYTVYYKVTADNYEDAEGSAVIKIAPKTVSLVWSDTEFTYDGKAHKPSANVSEKDIIGSDSVEVTVAGEQINAGSYTAQAVALNNSNYTLGADVSTAFVIKKAAATVTVDNTTKHIGKNDPKFTYKVTGLVEGESLKDITVARTAGETAGDYDITATAKAGSNANYDVTFVTGKLTIEDHTAVVDKAVAATCTETGLTEGSHCSVCNEVLVAQTVVDALGHDWSEWVKVGNREKSTCSRCGQVKYRNIETADTGNLEKDAEVAPGSPITEATLDNDKSELITASGIFTAEEKTAIENGADARVWLEISATANIADTDKQKVEAEAKKIMGSDISKVIYFDADLFKSVTKDGTTTKSQITEPGTEIEVSVSLPESLVQADSTISRAYKIIRLHNSEVDSFDAAFDKETGTLTFKTDRFSTYAIAFTDTQLATGVTLTPDSKTLTKKGETVQLTATVTPDNAADKKVTWTSSDSKVATVDENGLVTAVANGTAIITVTTEDGGKTATAKITVNISSDDDNNGDNGNNNNNNKDNGGSNGGSNNNPATTPDNKNNGADTKKDNQSVTAPQTGDTSNLALWTTLFMASLAGLVSLLVKRRKENCK